MDNGDVTSRGMSSIVNEFWNRASETDRSEIKTSSSSDDSADESKSSGREYRDASCSVDFDEEFDRIVDEEIDDIVDEEFNKVVDKDEANVLENSRQIIEYSGTKIEKNAENLKSSKYVRWDVLMSLGLGLWAVLCIVDVLHSKDSSTIGWFLELTREKKNVSKIALAKEPETHVWWLFHFWPHLWKIVYISSSGGVYILLTLLLIVFCADPRLRKVAGQATIEEKGSTRIPAAKEAKNSVPVNKNLGDRKKSQNSRVVRPLKRKAVPPNLVLKPAIHLHAKILSSAEQRLPDFKNTQRRNYAVKRRVANLPAMLQSSNRRLSECRKCFTMERSLFGQFRITSCRTLRFSSISKKESRSVVKASASVYLMDASTSTCSVRKINFEVEEYLRKTRKCSSAFNAFLTRRTEPRNSAELSRAGETRTRIITSSPAFKNFLLRLRHNSCVS